SFAAFESTLSSPVPARTTTRSPLARRSTSPVTLVAPRTSRPWKPSSACTRSSPCTPSFSTPPCPARRMRWRPEASALSVTRTFTSGAGDWLGLRPGLERGVAAALAGLAQRRRALFERADDRQDVAQVVRPHVAHAEDLALQVILAAGHHH